MTRKGIAIAIYHVMRATEDFDTTANILLELIRDTAQMHPGEPRHLYLDIDGHRNSAGGYDHDALEIQKDFILGFLSKWLTGITIPLVRGCVTIPHQSDEIPGVLEISGPPPQVDQCGQGHELTAENSKYRTNGTSSWKVCRKCEEVRRVASVAKKKARQQVRSSKKTGRMPKQAPWREAEDAEALDEERRAKRAAERSALFKASK